MNFRIWLSHEEIGHNRTARWLAKNSGGKTRLCKQERARSTDRALCSLHPFRLHRALGADCREHDQLTLLVLAYINGFFRQSSSPAIALFDCDQFLRGKARF